MRPGFAKFRRLPRAVGGGVVAGLALGLFLHSAPGFGAKQSPAPVPAATLQGKLLVAAPRVSDPWFRETVVLMVHHDEQGAFGLVLNRVLVVTSLDQIFAEIGVEPKRTVGEVAIHYGGPTEPEAGFVVHSPDFRSITTMQVGPGIAVSSEDVVLEAVARDEGPKQAVYVIGYASWGPGELEREIAAAEWFAAPADDDLVFDADMDSKWRRAIESRYRTL